MTIQEKAIEQLERISRHLATIGEKEDYTDVAIQALEQESCEDAVNRKVVLDMMQMCMGGKELYKAVYDLPPVTPARKKGKWIFTKTILNKYGSIVECPSCHKKWTTYDEIRFEKENKYCPNCGEEMESKEFSLNQILQIIDKYKAETEGEE